MSLLTYNVLFNRAISQLGPVLQRYSPDIICLQEVDTNEVNLKSIENYGYRLADYSNSFIKYGRIYGQATYYNRQSSIRFINSHTLHLKKSIYEFIITIIKLFNGGNNSRTILETRFIHKDSHQKITVFNLHLSDFGSNSIRLKQINQLLKKTQQKSNEAMIITGDFNYPYGRKKLEQLMHRYHFKEATRNVFFTFQRIKGTKYNPLFCWGDRLVSLFGKKNHKLDYIFYQNLTLQETRKINVNFSDHYPILSRFQLID